MTQSLPLRTLLALEEPVGTGGIAWNKGRNRKARDPDLRKERRGDGFLEELIHVVKTRSASGG